MTTLAITCLRDEGPWLLDWIAHHRAAGFDHFLIASHDCRDGSDRLLDALGETGFVTHLPFSPSGPKAVQWQALKRLNDHPLYRDADMALFFDVDEYLVLHEGASLHDLIPEGVDAVPLRWHLFGHSGLSQWQDLPVSDRFRHAAPDDIALPLAQMFKTLHRPAAFDALGVHRPKAAQPDSIRWQSTTGRPLGKNFAKAQGLIRLPGLPAAPERAWLNHYSVRSIEEFVLKSARGLPNHMSRPLDAGYWALRNFNTVTDNRIAPMRPASAAARDTLRDFDVLHHETVAHHRDRLAQLQRDRAVIDLMWQLELLAGSTPPTPAKLAAHAARITAAQAEARKT